MFEENLSLRLSVYHIDGVSLNLLVRPLDQPPSFRFPNRMRLEEEPTTKGHALCSQWLFTIYLGELVGLRFGRIQNILNLVPEQRLLFAQISSIHRKNGLEDPPKLGSNMALKKMEHEFPFGTFRSEKKEDYLVQEFHCSMKLCTGTTQKVVFHLLSNRIFRNLLVNGKPPISPLIFLTYHEKKTIFETGPRSSVSYAKSYRA